jgi:hypothetical protein
MLHQIEYRIYWVLWAIVPLLLATTVFMIPALQKTPEIEIVLADSLTDHLFKANEPIVFAYRAVALPSERLAVTWTFGGPVYAWQALPPDTCERRLAARLDWEAGAENPLGLKLDVKYDSLEPLTRYGWQNVFAVSDSVAHIKFSAAGSYRFKLKLEDLLTRRSYMQESTVEIVPETEHFPEDTIVKIVGPTKGLVGEELVFSATGSTANFWYWKFGDNRNQDANQPQVVYSYSQEGKWEVTLKTDNPDRWFSHWVEIFPTWNADSIPVEIVDTVIDVTPKYQLDLKNKFQEIANTSTANRARFYDLKNAIHRNYLSDRQPTIYVWVNEDKEPVDFDSYCQRIHFLEGDLVIEKVTFAWDGDSTRHRIRELSIQQRRLNN